MSRTGRNVGRFAEAIAFLMKQPRTPGELTDALDTSCDDTARMYLHALKAEGLVYIKEWITPRSGPAAPRYAWQPQVLFYSDTEAPAMGYEPRKGSVASMVLAWLRADQTNAEFTAVEITAALGIRASSFVSQELKRLVKHGLAQQSPPERAHSYGVRFRALRVPPSRDSGSRMNRQGCEA